MSRKKNTLKDLDEFLKQQAATLATPTPLKEKVKEVTPEKEPRGIEIRVQKVSPDEQKTAAENIAQLSAEKIFRNLEALASQEGENFRTQFYELIIRTVESMGEYTPEDRMLINTALYLKSSDNWKEVIQSYWRSRAQ